MGTFPQAYQFTTRTGERRTIHALSEDAAAHYHVLGVADAISIGHAVLLGDHHCVGFLERVEAYRVTASPLADVMKQPQGETTYRVTFYDLPQ